MKITRRLARRISVVVAVRKAERDAEKPKLNYDNLMADLLPIG
jgi:hypothetical protein